MNKKLSQSHLILYLLKAKRIKKVSSFKLCFHCLRTFRFIIPAFALLIVSLREKLTFIAKSVKKDGVFHPLCLTAACSTKIITKVEIFSQSTFPLKDTQRYLSNQNNKYLFTFTSKFQHQQPSNEALKILSEREVVPKFPFQMQS